MGTPHHLKRALVALLVALATTAAGAAGMIEGGPAQQRYRYEEVDRLVIEADFLDVRVFGAARNDVQAELTVSQRMLRRNAPRIEEELRGAKLTLRLVWNERLVSPAARAWGQGWYCRCRTPSSWWCARAPAMSLSIASRPSTWASTRRTLTSMWVTVRCRLVVEGGAGQVSAKHFVGRSSSPPKPERSPSSKLPVM